MSGLDWPDGFARTPAGERVSTAKFSAGSRQTRREIGREMEHIDADEWALDEANGSTDEPGVVLRWASDGRNYAVACDLCGYPVDPNDEPPECSAVQVGRCSP